MSAIRPSLSSSFRTALVLLFALTLSFDSFSSTVSSSHSAELIASTEPGWPQFRGKRRDGKSDERGLLQAWPDGGPRKLWSVDGLGRGYSSPIIVNGKIYITGDFEAELHLFCLNEADRKLLWSVTSGPAWKNPYPGARATPTYSDGQIYLQNAHGHIRAYDAETGTLSWEVDLFKEFQGNNITWGMSECLLVDDQAVYSTAGGRKALVVALDKKTGKVLWKSEPLFDSDSQDSLENASYVSPILVQYAGRRLLIGCSLRYLYCVDADSGVIQWTRRFPTAYSVLAMMPVLVNDSIFMTAPHGKPGALLTLLPPKKPGDKIGFEQQWETALDTCQGSVVYHNGKLIGSFYPGRKGWAAVDPKSGALLYQAEDYVKGAVLYADNRYYTLSENGWMRLLEAASDRFISHGEFRLAQANNDAWAHPVILNKRLYLRYQEELFCFDIESR